MNETALVESSVYLCVHLDFLAGGIVAECCDSSQLERRLHDAELRERETLTAVVIADEERSTSKSGQGLGGHDLMLYSDFFLEPPNPFYPMIARGGVALPCIVY